MRRLSLEVRAIAFAFLWLCVLESGWATRKEDLERAAELAVERAAERAAERAVEKALESGNSTTESETIRESYSSVRKYDKTLKLPETGYTPDQRREYDRIMREREAAERASAVLKRSPFAKRSVNKGSVDGRELLIFNGDQTGQDQHQMHLYENHQEAATSATTSWPFHVTSQYPFPAEGHRSYDTDTAAVDSQWDYREKPPPVTPVKIFAIRTKKPYQQLYHIAPVTPSDASSTFFATNPHYIYRRAAKVVNTENYAFVGKHRS